MKNLFKIIAASAFVGALLFNVSLSGESFSSGIDLSSLTKISEANAECAGSQPWSASGRCLVLSDICVFSTPPDRQCDPHGM